MLIALDFDDTVTLDPTFWNSFVIASKKAGHGVIIVTMRNSGSEAERVRRTVHAVPHCDMYFTNRLAKRPFMASLGITPCVWIDDKPEYVVGDLKL
jgi:hypothetical protein